MAEHQPARHPDHTQDPFHALALEPRFDLDSADIDRAHLLRLAAAHPDRAADPNPDAARLAARLNAARHTLRDPERRAVALLARLGGPSKEDNATLPPGFLMTIMETREQVEADLAADPHAAREKWGAWAEAERERYANAVRPLFHRAQAHTTPDTDALAEIRTILNAWRYIERLAEQLDPEYDPARADFNA